MAETYYGSAGKDADAGLARILEATKIAGKAGQDAYNEAAGGMDARQKEALARAGGADAFVGGGSTLFKDRAVSQDARFRNALDTARSGYTQGLAGTAASATSYMNKLKAALPALQAQNSQLLASKEGALAGAAAKKKASEEKTKIIGETQAELDALLRERETLRTAKPQAEATVASWGTDTSRDKSGVPKNFNAAPLEHQIGVNQKRMKELEGGHHKIPRDLLMSGDPSKYGGETRKKMEEYQHLMERNQRFQGALDKMRAPAQPITSASTPLPAGVAGPVKQVLPQDRLAAVESRIAELQASQQRPSEISNRIAVDKYKWDPALAKGTFTDALWKPMVSATGEALAPEISPMAASLAAKGDVLMGEADIQSILDDPNVLEDVQSYQRDAASGEMTLSEADEQLRKDLLGDEGPENGYEIYQVMRAILGTMGWKKDKK